MAILEKVGGRDIVYVKHATLHHPGVYLYPYVQADFKWSGQYFLEGLAKESVGLLLKKKDEFLFSGVP